MKTLTPEDYDRPGIYVIRNKITGAVYVGQTGKPIRVRFFGHVKGFNMDKGNIHLKRAWKLHGPENFLCEPLIHCPLDELTLWEQHFLDIFNRESVQTYNHGPCADPPCRGVPLTNEHRLKVSEGGKRGWKKRPRTLTPEHRYKLCLAQKGKHAGFKMSEETKAHLRKVMAGRVPSLVTRLASIRATKGSHHSIETKIRMSFAHRGKKHSPKHVENNVLSRLNNRLSLLAESAS